MRLLRNGCSFESSSDLNQVRDEVKKNDPSLVEFSKLSEHERNRNLHVAQDTLRYLLVHADSFNLAKCFDAFNNLDTDACVERT